METTAHRNLKRLAAAHLLSEGYQVVGLEVRCPGSRYRVDVAGYLDRLPWPKECDNSGAPTLWSTVPRTQRQQNDRRCNPRTVIIECKQSRGDFIRDDRRADELITLRHELAGWKQHIEEKRIKVLEPQLRQSGSALFPELETWDFSASRLVSYRRLLKRIRLVEAKLYGGTKFFRIAQYRLADRLFICVPRGLIRRREIPPGWGLLECRRDKARSRVEQDNAMPATIRTAIESPEYGARPDRSQQFLRNIAVAATREAFRQR